MDVVELSPAQRRAVESQAPITLVLGSAGTGKTTTAIAAAHRALTLEDALPHHRVLFLTFSRTAAADEARQRSFDSEAIRHAVRLGRLHVRQYSGDSEDHFDETFEEVRTLAESGARSVGIFLHGTDAVASLSARFAEKGVEHVVAGLGESHAEAVRALADLVGFATGHVDHASLRRQLAVYAAATRRRTPDVAYMLAGTRPFESTALEQRLVELERRLVEPMALGQLMSTVSAFWPALGITVGQTEWRRAAGAFAVLARMSLPASSRWPQDVPRLRIAAEQAAGDALLSSSGESIAPIRLMNFHQTKGREADAAVLVFTTGDFFGRESPPYPAASRLLYVAMTRARHNVRVDDVPRGGGSRGCLSATGGHPMPPAVGVSRCR